MSRKVLVIGSHIGRKVAHILLSNLGTEVIRVEPLPAFTEPEQFIKQAAMKGPRNRWGGLK